MSLYESTPSRKLTGCVLDRLVQTTAGKWIIYSPTQVPQRAPGRPTVCRTAPATPKPSRCPDAVGHVRISAEGCVGIRSTDALELRVNGDGPTRRQGHGALTALAARRDGRRRRRLRRDSNRCCVVGCEGRRGQSYGSTGNPQIPMVANVSFFIWMPPLWPPPIARGRASVMVISGCSPAAGPRPGGPRGASTSPASPRAPGAP